MGTKHPTKPEIPGSGIGSKTDDLTFSRLIRDFSIILLFGLFCAFIFGWWFGYNVGKDHGKTHVYKKAESNGFGHFFVDSLSGQKEFMWRE